jgi:hypothetical protein
LENIHIKGIVNVEGFKDVPVLMFIISATIPDSETPVARDEGTPIWIKYTELENHKMLEDVKKIVELVETTPEGKIFHVVSKFEDRKLISFKVS